MNPNNDDGRKLIAGAFIDFLSHLSSSPSPILVGAEYPRDRLMKAFAQWSNKCGFDTVDASIHLWKDACNSGFMQKRKKQ